MLIIQPNTRQPMSCKVGRRAHYPQRMHVASCKFSKKMTKFEILNISKIHEHFVQIRELLIPKHFWNF